MASSRIVGILETPAGTRGSYNCTESCWYRLQCWKGILLPPVLCLINDIVCWKQERNNKNVEIFIYFRIKSQFSYSQSAFPSGVVCLVYLIMFTSVLCQSVSACQDQSSTWMGKEGIFCYLCSMEHGILICCSILTILHGRTKQWQKITWILHK